MPTTKKRPGRPKTEDPKLQVPIRMSTWEKAKFQKKAAACGQELAAWIRFVCHQAS